MFLFIECDFVAFFVNGKKSLCIILEFYCNSRAFLFEMSSEVIAVLEVNSYALERIVLDAGKEIAAYRAVAVTDKVGRSEQKMRIDDSILYIDENTVVALVFALYAERIEFERDFISCTRIIVFGGDFGIWVKGGAEFCRCFLYDRRGYIKLYQRTGKFILKISLNALVGCARDIDSRNENAGNDFYSVIFDFNALYRLFGRKLLNLLGAVIISLSSFSLSSAL